MGRQRAVARDDGPAVGRDRDSCAAEGEHRLDRQAHARLELACRGRRSGSSGPAAPRASPCRCRGRRTGGRSRSRAARRRPRSAAEMSLDVAAGHGRGDAGHHRQAGRVDERRDRLGRPSPTKNVRAPSPCQPSKIAPASIETIWPVADRPVAGDAVDDLVVDRDAEAGRERVARVAPVALERRDRAGRAGCALRPARSRWAVETPGRSSDSTRARTSATIRPARRIRSISAGDLTGHGHQAPPCTVVPTKRQQIGRDVVDGAPAVDGPEDAPDRGSGRSPRAARPSCCSSRARIVSTRSSARWMSRDPSRSHMPGHLGRVGLLVVDVPVRLADPAARHPPHELVGRDLDLERLVDPRAVLVRARRRGRPPGRRSVGIRRG